MLAAAAIRDAVGKVKPDDSVATMSRKPPADVIDEFKKTVAGWK